MSLWTVAVPARTAAQDSPPLTKPFVCLSLRSVERGLEILDRLFDSILRPDLAELTRQALTEEGLAVDALPGIDPSRPLGYLLILQGGDPLVALLSDATTTASTTAFVTEGPSDGTVVTEQVEVDFDTTPIQQLLAEPQVVAFIGVADLKAARKLLDSGLTPTTRLDRVSGRDDLFQAIDSEDNEVALTIRSADGAVLALEGSNSGLLDQVAALEVGPMQLGERHDVLVTLQMAAISDDIRRRFSETLWNTAGPTLQQRDDEPAEEFELRNAVSRTLVELLDVAVTGIAEASAAADLQTSERRIRTRIEVYAKEGSPLDKRLAHLDGPQSMFQPLHDPKAALSLCLSLKLTKFEQEHLLRWVRLVRAISSSEGVEAEIQEGFGLLCEALQATITDGSIDFFIQLEVTNADQFGVVGGLRLAQSGLFRQGLQQLGARYARELQENAAVHSGETFDEVQAEDIQVVRCRSPELIDLPGGETRDADLCAGVGRGALWFAGGAFDSAERLRQALQTLDAAERDNGAARNTPPLLITANAAAWQQLPYDADDFDQRLQRGLAEEAFAEDHHARLELRPMRDGVRLEGFFEEGFLRWFALLLANEHDASEL